MNNFKESDPFIIFKPLFEYIWLKIGNKTIVNATINADAFASEKNGKEVKNKLLPLLPKEAYILDVQTKLNNLLTPFKNIEILTHYSLSYPKSWVDLKRQKKIRISQSEWLKYNLVFLSSNIYTIEDSCLILVSSVYKLGLDPRDCTLKTITRHSSIKNTPTKKLLEKLHKELEQNRNERNFYLHRGEEPSLGKIIKDNELARMYETFVLMDSLNSNKVNRKIKKLIADITKFILSKWRSNHDPYFKNIINLVKDLMIILLKKCKENFEYDSSTTH